MRKWLRFVIRIFTTWHLETSGLIRIAYVLSLERRKIGLAAPAGNRAQAGSAEGVESSILIGPMDEPFAIWMV
ncbi:MAG TPA: hypothetical protein VMU48_18325 [Terracidiphilus sp.]|nr:hypothetical protein [Terracidiphilus sp.]